MPIFRFALLVSVLFAAVLFWAGTARAAEGMWLMNELPLDAIAKDTGRSPDAAWVARVQGGAARLANGCSASFVSPRGLVMTNHHCVRSCLEELSSKKRDLLEQPFVAKTNTDELRCDRLELNRLVEITDVSARVLEATKGATGAVFAQKLKAEKSAIESTCAANDAARRCDLVTLFNGARFHLYRYQRYRDVRLVFAPEFAMAAWGGDPDNFQFPRYGLDAAFVRVWDGDVPAQTPFHLSFAKDDVKDGDAVFVVGHPGGTERSSTVAQLAFQRDKTLPWTLLHLAELRGRLAEWMGDDIDRQRKVRSRLRAVENGLKALRGRLDALGAPGFFARRQRDETAIIAKAPAHTKGAWAAVEQALTTDGHRLFSDWKMMEGAEAFQGDLFGHARMIVRLRAERAEPDAERLPEYTSAQLPFLQKQLESSAPIHADVEQALLTWSLTRMQNLRGADDPFVKRVLAVSGRAEDARALARRLVKTTRLADPKFRAQALSAATLPDDPMLALAALVDGDARAVRKQWEDLVEAPQQKAGELIAEGRRAALGTSGYPDATFTLRLSWGRVAGTQNGAFAQKASTTAAELYGRAGPAFPFALPPSWKKAQSKVPPATLINIATTNDIIGGNSGSPLLNANGDVVGLVFDGNLPSLGGRYVYDAADNRAVAVHAAGLRAALRDVYGAAALLDELSTAH